jgi:outer membrane receptor for ferrienterochelin and colicin
MNASSLTQVERKYTSSLSQASIFAQTVFHPHSNHSITAGIRSNTIGNYTFKPITNIEPRFNYRYSITPDLSLSASASRMTQSIHRIANSGLGLPFEIFLPADSNLIPESSWNFSIGGAKDITANRFKLSLSAELWYKTFQNITEFKDGFDATTSLLKIDGINITDPFVKNITDIVTQGKGEAYGVDFSTVLDTRWLKLTLDYTLMKATNQFAELNNGRPFDAPTDMRHTLNTTAEIKLSDTWTLSAIWQYHTGRPITMPTSVIAPRGINIQSIDNGYMNDIFIPIITERNNYRMKDFHRLDIAFSHKYKAFGKYDGLFSVGIYNVYNRANPYLYYIDTQNVNGTPKPVLKSLSIFPILPSVSWSVRF